MDLQWRYRDDRDRREVWIEELAATFRVEVDAARALLDRACREAAHDP